MATLNPAIILGQQYAKMPTFDMSDTMVNIAKMKAYQTNQRLDELKLTQAERAETQKQEWQQLWGEVWKPQSPAQGGLTAPAQASPQVPPGQPQQAAGPPMSLADVKPPGAMPQASAGAPGMGISQTDFTGPTGMAANVPSNQWMDVNTQTGEWSQPGGGQPGVAPSPAAPPPPPGPPGLTGAPAGAPAAPSPSPIAPTPPAGPQSLATERPGLPEMPGLNMPQMNEQAFWRAYQKDPERTTKEYGNLLEVHGKKLEQVEKTNDSIYNTLLAVEESDNPAAMWPKAIQSLRKKGIPIPHDMSETYDPAMSRFLLKQHEGVKTRLENAKIGYYKAMGVQNMAQARKQESEVRTPVERELEVNQRLATLEKTLTETTDIGKRRQLEREKFDLDKEKVMLDALKAEQQAGKDKVSQEQTAMAHVANQFKDFRSVRDAMGRVNAMSGKPDAAGDASLIYAYFKLLDPDTGIRDAETTRAESLGGLWATAKRWKAKVDGGDTLPDDVRKQLKARAAQLYTQYEKDYGAQAENYRKIFTNQGLNPDNILVDLRSTTPAGKRDQPSPFSPGGGAKPQATTTTPAGQPRLLGHAELQQLAEQRSAALGRTVTVDEVKKDLDPKKFRTQ